MSDTPDAKRRRREDDEDNSNEPSKDEEGSSRMDIEGALPMELRLVAPFLTVSELPMLAAVSRGARQLARSFLKLRLTSDDSRQLRQFDDGIKKQDTLTHETMVSIPPWYTNGLDFRELNTCPRAALEERGGRWYIKIRDKYYLFPRDQLDPGNTRIHHCSCSMNDDATVVIASVSETYDFRQDYEDPDEFAADWEEHNIRRSLWSILYDAWTGDGDQGNEPACVQELKANIHYLLADCDDGDWGQAVRSGDGKCLVAVTEQGGYAWNTDWIGDEVVENCTLTIYKVTEAGLEKSQDLLVEWCDSEYGKIDASLSRCGRLLSVKRTRSQYDPVSWALYDLRSNPASLIFEKRVSCEGYFTVHRIYFTADREVVVELSQDDIESSDEFRPYKFEGEGSNISQYVERYFGFLKDIPSFAKRVIIQYAQSGVGWR